MVDDIVRLTNVDDMALVEMVRRQPIVGILPLSAAFQKYRHVSKY